MSYGSSLDFVRDDRRTAIDETVEGARKSLLVAYVLWFFFGGLGVHNFYLGKPVLGGLQLLGLLLYLYLRQWGGATLFVALPFGLLLLLVLLVDMAMMPARVRAHSEKLRARLEQRIV